VNSGLDASLTENDEMIESLFDARSKVPFVARDVIEHLCLEESEIDGSDGMIL
jgi:hypothetical protein